MKTLVRLTLVTLTAACTPSATTYGQGDSHIHIEAGAAWLHPYPLVLGFHKHNPPQIAVWLEDTRGHYLRTLYVSRTIATQSWRFAGGNPRKEALPHWQHRAGRPLPDAVSGATPRHSFTVRLDRKGLPTQYTIKIEVNQSTDWNDAYPANAAIGAANYSGGTGGSGQPALIYAATIDNSSGQRHYTARLIGHSAPDGSHGDIITDMTGISDARHIIRQVQIEIR